MTWYSRELPNFLDTPPEATDLSSTNPQPPTPNPNPTKGLS